MIAPTVWGRPSRRGDQWSPAGEHSSPLRWEGDLCDGRSMIAPTGVVGLTEQNGTPLCDYSSVTPKGVPPSLTREGRQRKPSFFYTRGFEFSSWYGRGRASLYEPSLVREGGPRQRWMSSHTGAFLLVSPMPHKKDRPSLSGRSFSVRSWSASTVPRHGRPRPF